MKTVCFVLQDIGKNIYTLKDVVDEIRDKPTRRSLSFLPYQLNFKEPHPEHIRKSNSFLKTQNILPLFIRSIPDSRERCVEEQEPFRNISVSRVVLH